MQRVHDILLYGASRKSSRKSFCYTVPSQPAEGKCTVLSAEQMLPVVCIAIKDDCSSATKWCRAHAFPPPPTHPTPNFMQIGRVVVADTCQGTGT